MNKLFKNINLIILLSFAAQANVSAWYNPVSWWKRPSVVDLDVKPLPAGAGQLKSFDPTKPLDSPSTSDFKIQVDALVPPPAPKTPPSDDEKLAQSTSKEKVSAENDIKEAAEAFGHNPGKVISDAQDISKKLEAASKNIGEQIDPAKKAELDLKIDAFNKQSVTDEEHQKFVEFVNQIISDTATWPFRLAEELYGCGDKIYNMIMLPVDFFLKHSLFFGMTGLYYMGTLGIMQAIKVILIASKWMLKGGRFVVGAVRTLFGYFISLKDFLGPTGMVIGGVGMISIIFGLYWYWLQSYEKRVHYHVQEVLESVQTLKEYPTDSASAGKLTELLFKLGNLAKKLVKEGNNQLASICFELIEKSKKYMPFLLQKAQN